MEKIMYNDNYKNIYDAYKYFVDKLPLYLQKFDGDRGGCGAWAIGLHNYFLKLGYKPIIKELNKGIHYWIEVEGCSMDWQNFIKQSMCPDMDYMTGENDNDIVIIPKYKMFRVISKRVAYGDLYIHDFYEIGEKIAETYYTPIKNI